MTKDSSVRSGGVDDGNGWAMVHDALNRMKRAHDRGTGCHLTAGMIQALSLSFLSETWSEPDPRTQPKGNPNVQG